jgi:hypothetical protein
MIMIKVDEHYEQLSLSIIADIPLFSVNPINWKYDLAIKLYVSKIILARSISNLLTAK